MNTRFHSTLWAIPALFLVHLTQTYCTRNEDPPVPVPVAPVIISQSVSDVFSTSATLRVNLEESPIPVTVYFEYGPTADYGNTIAGTADPVFKSGSYYTAVINSLTRGTLYHFRVKAVNSLGTTYGDDLTFTARLGLGEAWEGGFIIYLDETGEHGLIAADTDQGTGLIWDNGANCFKTNVTSTLVGSGKPNTARLVSVLGYGDYPARFCNDLVLNGYDDWFLPSLQEFDLLKKSLSVFERKYKLNGVFYWTSSEAIMYDGSPSCYAMAENIFTGEQRTWAKNDTTPYFRAVRAF